MFGSNDDDDDETGPTLDAPTLQEQAQGITAQATGQPSPSEDDTLAALSQPEPQSQAQAIAQAAPQEQSAIGALLGTPGAVPLAAASAPVDDAARRQQLLDTLKARLGPQSAAQRAALVQQAQAGKNSFGLNLAQGLAGFGASLAHAPGSEQADFDRIRAGYDAPVQQFDRSQAQALNDFQTNSTIDQNQHALAVAKDEADPNSPKSKLAQALAAKMLPSAGDKFASMSAAQIGQLLPSIEGAYKIDEARRTRQDSLAQAQLNHQDQVANRQQQMALAENKYSSTLSTPFGLATTPEAAKTVNSAATSKGKLDDLLGQMIDMRQKYGSTITDRDAVAKAKQLATQAVAEAKNLYFPGRFTEFEKNMLDKMIPENPLGFSASQLAGQDPIMAQLQQFKSQGDLQFNSQLANSLRDPTAVKAKVAELQKQHQSLPPGEGIGDLFAGTASAATPSSQPSASVAPPGMVRVVSPSGQSGLIPQANVATALSKGYKTQ